MAESALAFQAGRAAMYVRMSTEHQQYSTENQADSIREYADQHNFSIVKTFLDYGKSGVKLSSRPALIELLREVESGAADFETVLVYDVSRWGRFQDTDESAYYEYVCKRNGVLIHYCAEEFENDGSISSALLKTIKRSMAGEYSRELSVKVFAGQCRLFEMGYRQGGYAGFGFRRQLLDRDGNIKGLLRYSERKSIQSDRVVLIPGPEEELSLIREIFTLFTTSLESETGIARLLNQRGLTNDLGRAWTGIGIHGILTNSRLIGTSIYNRRSHKLSKKLVQNPSSMWMRRDDPHGALIPQALFLKAQELIEARQTRKSDENLLTSLRQLWAKHGRLSAHLIGTEQSMACVCVFRKRFQCLTRAYNLIGYKPHQEFRYARIAGKLFRQQRELRERVKSTLRSYGAVVEDQASSNILLVNGKFTILVVLCCCNETRSGNRWSVGIERRVIPDITLAARLASDNSAILDYYLFPSLDQHVRRITLMTENPCGLEVYRFDTLDFLMSLARRNNMVQTS
jgi:DNA invertase Pin-like site-specific DNA recombinase